MSGYRTVFALMITTVCAAGAAAEDRMGASMGVSWGPTYGFPPSNAEVFVPQARKLGATSSRITLYWSQLEPRQGVDRWDDLDAYLGQLESPDEGMITLASASPWATHKNAWVFPSSPAKDRNLYCAFVRRVVEHVRGRIRFFQNETEPGNPFFWSGTADEYAVQQKLFYQTVREADPNAVIVLAGFDGLFDPTGVDPLPGETANLAFLKAILEGVRGAFDVFDIHLYGDAYTIPARIDAVRRFMLAAGAEKPVMVGEYAGPGFFEFRANRRWFGELQGANASAENVRRLRKIEPLPAETKMFLMGFEPEWAARLLRLQSADLVVRNLMALESGAIRTAFFDLWHDTADGDSPNTVIYGAFRLLDHDHSGSLQQELPLSQPFKRLTTALAGETLVRRIPLAADPAIYAFRVERKDRGPLLVAWRRPERLGGTCLPVHIEIPWTEPTTHGIAIDGTEPAFRQKEGRLTVNLSDMPILID
jgi:hypothetical protein